MDILVDVDNIVGFTRCFIHMAGREKRDRETLKRHLLATLFAYGTNIGPYKMATASGMDHHQFVYIKKWYLYEEALKQANVMLVNNLHSIKTSYIWGDGTACASDGRMFSAYDHNLFAKWYNRYGGNIILVYWHVVDKYVSVYSQVDHPSASQVLLMLEGLIRHDTEMAVKKNFVDSHGQSEVAFAFCILLGFRLLPRLKRIKDERLYRPDRGLAYKNLESVMTRPINWDLIRDNYEMITKIAVAIAENGVSPIAVLRRFNTYSRRNTTYRAILEFGKVVKTNFLCEYLPSPDLQREVQEGLNKVEAWNGLNSFIHYGKAGGITERQLMDQRQSVACLQLIQSCIIFWNTYVMDLLFGDRNSQFDHSKELNRLSPLLHHHINPYGRFTIDLQGSGVLERFK